MLNSPEDWSRRLWRGRVKVWRKREGVKQSTEGYRERESVGKER